jgi:hypothetical protein
MSAWEADMPRRFVSVLAAVGMLLILVAPAAAAGKPEHFPAGIGDPVELPAGYVCDFAVRWDTTISHVQVLIFPALPNGDQVVRQTGDSTVVVTNTTASPNRSVTLNIANRQDLIFHADGTITARIDGAILAAYAATDAGGPGMFYFRGHLHDELDSSFTGLSHEFVGTTVDLCAALGS